MLTDTVPVFSIVTPSYNQAQFLEECIDSVLGQGYPNLEYVIMDGGSTDGSCDIIKKYEKYLTYWQSCPDGGQYQALHEGFKHTSGEVMAWLNADDKYHPLAFAKVASTLVRNPDVRWLTGRMCYWDAAGDLTKISSSHPVFSRLKYLSGHFDKPYIQQESTFWRRSLWQEAGSALGTHYRLAEDLGLWCRFFRHAPLYTLDACLGGYRYYGDQRGVTCADQYYSEACELIAHEKSLLPPTNSLFSPPPDSLTIDRDQLARFFAENHLHLDSPSLRACWRHYTENLIGMVNSMFRKNDYALLEFIRGEVLMLALLKPSAITLTADRLDELGQRYDSVILCRQRGDLCVESGDLQQAQAHYRNALELWPTDIETATQLLALLSKLSVKDALELMVRFLPEAAHHKRFVSSAAALLEKLGAKEQASELCREYLMANPHDAEIARQHERNV